MAEGTPKDELTARLAEAVNTIWSCVPDLLTCSNNSLKVSDLTPELQETINKWKLANQLASPLLGSPTPNDTKLPQDTQTPHVEDSAISSSKSTMTTKPKPDRRRKNVIYDYLLLDAFRHEETYGPIGQSTLLALAEEFDPNTKKRSLIAKLNRWKNENGYLEWSNSENLRLTDKGRAHRDGLLKIVKRDGGLELVADAYETALGLEVDVDK